MKGLIKHTAIDNYCELPNIKQCVLDNHNQCDCERWLAIPPYKEGTGTTGCTRQQRCSIRPMEVNTTARRGPALKRPAARLPTSVSREGVARTLGGMEAITIQ